MIESVLIGERVPGAAIVYAAQFGETRIAPMVGNIQGEVPCICMPHVYSSHLLLTGRRIPTGLQLEGKFSLTVLNGMGFLAGLQN